MATISKLQVELSLIDKMTSGLNSATGGLESFGRKATDVGQTLTTRVTLPLIVLGGVAVKAASDLSEAMSAVTPVFEQNADAILKWSRTSAQAFGLSRAEALTAATQFGAFFKGLDFGATDVANFSTRMVRAAADLSSFWNVPTTTVLEDLRSGISGQYEPLLKYGIVLNEAIVKQRAMADTGKTSAEALTQQEIAAARYNLILEGLGAAEGDRARTADSFANQMRTLRAEFQNASAALGTQLLPALTQLVATMTAGVVAFQSMPPQLQQVTLAAAGIAAVIGPLALAIGFVASNLVIMAQVLGVAAAAGLYFYTVLLPLYQLVVILKEPFLALIAVVRQTATTVAAFAASTSATVGAMATDVASRLTSLVATIRTSMTTAKSVFATGWSDIKSTVTTSITETKDKVMSVLSAANAGIKAYLAVFLTVFTSGFQSIYDQVSIQMVSIKERIGGVLNETAGSVAGKAVAIGQNIGTGIIQGINNIWGSVVGTAAALGQAVTDALGAALKILSPSKVTAHIGEMVGAGLVAGMDRSLASVESAASGLALAAIPTPDLALAGAGAAGTANTVTINNYFNGTEGREEIADTIFARFSRELGLTLGGA